MFEFRYPPQPGMVSIVVPAYSRPDLLWECLQSIFDQSYSPLECVIVDDGSPENLLPLIETWTHDHYHPGLHWKCLRKANGGGCSARNYGMEHASGEYLLFLDSDDILLPDAINKVLGAIHSNACSIAYYRVQVTESNLQPREGLCYGSPASSDSNYYFDYNWHTIGALYSRTLLAKLGGWNENVSGNDDWEFQVRAKILEPNPAFVDEILAYYRDHQDQRLSVSQYDKDWMKDILRVLASIRDHLAAKKMLDPILRKRLAKRALIHALESGANKDHFHRKALCAFTQTLHPLNYILRFICSALAICPLSLPLSLLYKHIRQHGR